MSSLTNSLSSLHSVSVPLSVKSQTKDKFDVLLKKAQKKKNQSVSKEKLLTDLESTASSDRNDNAVENINFKEQNEKSENYLLNKFLGGESYVTESTKGVFKPPVPKPRTKKCFSPASQGTFKVTSPKITNFEDEKDRDSASSNKTYDVENNIGDVLHHVPKSKVIKQVVSTANKIDNLGNKPSNSESSDSSDNDEKIEVIANESIQQKNQLVEIETVEEKSKKKNYNYDKIIEVIVHKTDRLELSSLVIHPVVKIHIIDATTGKYLQKSDKSRNVVFFYENVENDYISPVMTYSYNLQEKRILYPSWEESILINEDYEYLKEESNRVIIFFEILDFLSISMLQQLKKQNSNGWHNIAFAFLKLLGKDGSLNIGKRVRLQLYHSGKISKKSNSQTCKPWLLWKKKVLKKYPSTLYVTIKSSISPTKVVETFRSKTPIQKETSSRTKLCDDLSQDKEADKESIHSTKSGCINETIVKKIKWSRKKNEICKLPNKCLVEFNSYDEGCFVMKFSNQGKYLACAVQIDNLFYVVIYSILTLREVNKLTPHQALIYDLKWSDDDSLLVSASADNTICVFDTLTWSFLQILPHPSFVYCCDINGSNTIASGCFDSIIRIWTCVEQNLKITDFNLFEELEGHAGYITSLCFSKNKSRIFSADSVGVIFEWQEDKTRWTLKRQINLLDLKETLINQILLFSKERKLFVHSRDNLIRIVDVKSGCVLQWLRGGSNKRFQIYGSITPCGNFIYSGSENGFINVWDSKSGNKIATYSPYSTSVPIHCVSFHPHDNILAISHYGQNLPILLYCYDSEITQTNINMTIINEDYYSETKTKSLIFDEKLSRISLRKHTLKKPDNKIDFRDVLQKMDSVITFQKQYKDLND